MKHIVLAGGSGFLGQALADYFAASGFEVVVLTRSPKSQTGIIREVSWDARTIGQWAQELDGAAAVVNLAGRSVNCRYTIENRRQIMDSRVLSTRALGMAMAQCRQPPRVWLNSSTATIYRHTYGPAWDEAGEIGASPEAKDAFSVEVARAWEKALEEAVTPRTRKIALRSALVLGNRPNSVLPVLQKLTRYGLGGTMGDGRQFVSWIHEVDFCRSIEWLITRENFTGAVNVCSPNPLTNAEMMWVFREAGRRPFGLPARRWMLEVGAYLMRTETELILKSRRVAPRRLLESGFEFRFPTLNDAVANLACRRK